MIKHKKSHLIDNVALFKKYYQDIAGGIDGYYEKTILNADLYELYDSLEKIGYFTVHVERGLTSLIVLPNHLYRYEEIFLYVVNLSCSVNIFFTENDIRFLNAMKKFHIPYEVQAYNFDITDKIGSAILSMKKTERKDIQDIEKAFKSFIEYNHIELEKVESFYYKRDNKFICFGALEALILNPKRYCISMVVNEAFRKQGYGTKVVQFLAHYLLQKGLKCNARCYVLNDISKKTLLKSGMIITNRLFKRVNKDD